MVDDGLLAGACFAVVGTAAALFGTRSGLRARIRAEGRVVRVFEGRDSDGANWFEIAVVFRANCCDHRVERPARWWIRPKEGQAVRVYFPPGRPDRATIDRWGTARWGLLVAVLGWAAIVANAGLWR